MPVEAGQPRGFFTKRNLTRLWNQVRRGGNPQSCHLTDPSHPDHLEAGCAEGAKAKECPGSVILVLREFEQLAGEERLVDEVAIARYLRERRRGLTKQGLMYWLVQRHQMGGVPFVGGARLPEVDMADETIGLPEYLGHG